MVPKIRDPVDPLGKAVFGPVDDVILQPLG
jgi:hypothetical protein